MPKSLLITHQEYGGSILKASHYCWQCPRPADQDQPGGLGLTLVLLERPTEPTLYGELTVADFLMITGPFQQLILSLPMSVQCCVRSGWFPAVRALNKCIVEPVGYSIGPLRQSERCTKHWLQDWGRTQPPDFKSISAAKHVQKDSVASNGRRPKTGVWVSPQTTTHDIILICKLHCWLNFFSLSLSVNHTEGETERLEQRTTWETY